MYIWIVLGGETTSEPSKTWWGGPNFKIAIFRKISLLTYPENSWLFLKRNKEAVCKGFWSNNFKPDWLSIKICPNIQTILAWKRPIFGVTQIIMAVEAKILRLSFICLILINMFKILGTWKNQIFNLQWTEINGGGGYTGLFIPGKQSRSFDRLDIIMLRSIFEKW